MNNIKDNGIKNCSGHEQGDFQPVTKLKTKTHTKTFLSKLVIFKRNRRDHLELFNFEIDITKRFSFILFSQIGMLFSCLTYSCS